MPRSSDVEESSRTVSSTDADATLATSRSLSETKYHATRMEQHRFRQSNFNDECRNLVSYLGKSNVLRKIDSTDALAEFEYKLGKKAEYGIISQSNLPGFSKLLQATSAEGNILVHRIELSDTRADYRRQLYNEGLKILRYFASNKSVISSSQGSVRKCNYFLRIMDIFLVDSGEQVLVMHERFDLDLSMQHKLWNGKLDGAYKTSNVKQWAIQVAEAVEILNLAGVVHRFVRPENILLIPRSSGQATIQLTSFDFACRYWNSGSSIGLGPKLPIELESHLLDHLPPECFYDHYDGSMVDVWSIGTMICLLMTDEIPFEVPDVVLHRGKSRYIHATIDDYIEKWRRCEERRMLPDEIRSLLDDIFKEPEARMCAWEVAKDQRLLCKTSNELNQMQLPAYYRIDLAKDLNLEAPELIRPTKKQIVPVDESSFAPESKHIFTMTSYEKVRAGGEAAITDYRVLREASFSGDLGSSVIMNDYYLKASRADQTEGADCLVKIVPMHSIPTRHRNMIITEGSKIMRYMSDTSPINLHIHRVLDMYLLSDAYFYIFLENLEQHQSIYHLVLPSTKSSSTRNFPPSLHSSVSLHSFDNIQAWLHALAQTVDSMGKLGLAHRYIRPEYVFVSKNEPTKIKLSHFDLACFVWNPQMLFLVRRKRGIQDEREHLWNHLPPECYDPLYDCLQVDVWSVAVLFAFCLTGKMPFTTPLTMSQAATQWSEFKLANSSVLLKSPLLLPSTQLLDLIFVSEEERLKAAQLVDKSVASKLIPRQRPRSSDVATRKSSTGSGGQRNSRGK